MVFCDGHKALIQFKFAFHQTITLFFSVKTVTPKDTLLKYLHMSTTQEVESCYGYNKTSMYH